MGKNLKKIVTLATIMTVLSSSALSAVPTYALDVNTENSQVEEAATTGKEGNSVTLTAEDYKEYDSELKVAGDFEYYVIGDSITLVKYVGNDTKVKISEDFDGKKITTISKDTFKDCTTIESIELPQYVSSISSEAFTGCTNLKEFKAENNKSYQVIGNALYTIKDSSKSDLRQLVKVPQALVQDDFAISDDTYKISDHAFEGCKGIKNITIPSSVTVIGNQGAESGYGSIATFSNCELENIEVVAATDDKEAQFSSNNGVLYSKDGTKLIKCPQKSKAIVDGSYNIPDKVSELVDNAFQGCSDLTQVGTLKATKIGDGAFEGCGLTNVTINPKVESKIGKLAFSNCENLKSVEIGSLVTSIGYGTFNNCPKLEKINVDSYNNYYTTINGVLYAYSQRVYKISSELDKLITAATINSSEEGYIGAVNNSKTENKTLVKDITLLPYATYASYYTIEKSGDIESIKKVKNASGNGISNLSGESKEIVSDSQASEAVPYQIVNKKYKLYSKKGDIIEKKSKYYEYTNLVDKAVNVLTKLDAKDISLTLVRCPQGIDATNISDTINSMPQKVNNIEAFAFQGCTTINKMVLPNSMENIGGSAFKDCTNLETITTGKQATKFQNLGTYAFSNCSKIKEISLPTLTSIRAYTFNNCSSLETITLGSGISSIDNRAFDGCTALKNITVPEGGDYYDKNGVLYRKVSNGVYLEKYPVGKTEESFEIPDNVTYIDQYAFRDSGKIEKIELANLKEIVLPDQKVGFHYKSIFEREFNTTKDVGKEFISLRVKGDISNSSYFKTGKDRNGDTLIGIRASSEGTMTIPKGSQIIVSGAFEGLKAHKLVIPTDISTIEQDAFDNFTVGQFEVSGNNFVVESCGSLMQNSNETDKNKNKKYILVKQPNEKNGTDYVAPENTTDILHNAFQDCDYAKINLGAKVSNLSSESFNSCPKLAEINVDENNTDYKSINGVLLSKDGKTLIKYPSGKTEGSYKIPDSVVLIKKNAFAGNTYIKELKTSHEGVVLEDGAFGTREALKLVLDTSTDPDIEKPTINVTSIKVKGDTIKTNYEVGSKLDLSNSMLTVTFDNNTTKEVQITEDMVSGFDANKVGTQDVKVTYGGKETTFQVVVSEKITPGITVSGIEIDGQKFVTNYNVGQDLQLGSATINVKMSNGTTKVVNITSDMVSGYDKYKEGKQTVTVTYEGKTATIDVTVSKVQAPIVTEVSLVPGTFTKTSYAFGEELDISKAELLVKKSDGTSETIKVTLDMVQGYDKQKSATQQVSFNYGGKSTVVEVTVQTKTGDNHGIFALGSLFTAAIAGTFLSRKKKNN